MIARTGTFRCLASCDGGNAVQVDQALHVEDDVGQPDLGRGSRDADRSDEQPHAALLLPKKTCSTRARTLDLRLLARRVVSGMGRFFGFLRWTRLTKPRRSMNASLAADL